VAAGDTLLVEARPTDGYYFETNDDRVDTWSFDGPAA
jgi:hypothetical protein